MIVIESDGRGSEVRRYTLKEEGWGGRPSCVWCGQPAKYIYRAYHFNQPAFLGRPYWQDQPVCNLGCLRPLG